MALLSRRVFSVSSPTSTIDGKQSLTRVGNFFSKTSYLCVIWLTRDSPIWELPSECSGINFYILRIGRCFGIHWCPYPRLARFLDKPRAHMQHVDFMEHIHRVSATQLVSLPVCCATGSYLKLVSTPVLLQYFSWRNKSVTWVSQAWIHSKRRPTLIASKMKEWKNSRSSRPPQYE